MTQGYRWELGAPLNELWELPGLVVRPADTESRWTLSPETLASIREIEDNIRAAPHRLRHILMD